MPEGLNLTRTFSGTYREIQGSFKIEKNTLAPNPEKYVAPWPRSQTKAAADGGNKFDLTRWNDAYFPERLIDVRRAAAGDRGVAVEFVFFCPFYDENLWEINPR